MFPGAEGFGTTTTAGSGRHLDSPSATVYLVSNLSNDGAGSLRKCMEASGPRTCIFETSGAIWLEKAIQVKEPYLTVAGQTAPSPGIAVFGAGLQIETHDVLLRHLQVRVGDKSVGPKPSTRDALTVIGRSHRPAYNVVLDHLSLSWAVDENFSTYGGHVSDITLSNSIISEALMNSIHPKGSHSKGMLIGDDSKRVSLHHNLLAHNHDRNPRMKPGADVEFIGNFVYNWGGTSPWNGANLSDTGKTGIPVIV